MSLCTDVADADSVEAPTCLSIVSWYSSVYGRSFLWKKPGEVPMGRKFAQLIDVSGLLGDALNGGGGTGKRCPCTFPVERSTNGVANSGGTGLW